MQNCAMNYWKRYWENRRGDFTLETLHFTVSELEKVTGGNITDGIKEFLKKKVVSEEVSVKSVGTNTDFVCTCYKSPEIILNIPGQPPLPMKPISEDESKSQWFSQE